MRGPILLAPGNPEVFHGFDLGLRFRHSGFEALGLIGFRDWAKEVRIGFKV